MSKGIYLSRIRSIATRITRLPDSPEKRFCETVLPHTSIVADISRITTEVPEYNQWVEITFSIVESCLDRLEDTPA